jgi:hypothetical protein
MRFLKVGALLSLSLSISANDQWYGFCVVQQGHQRVCSAPQPKVGDFSPVCDAFAGAEGAYAWNARFANDLAYLKYVMPNYCDVIRDETDNSFYACQLEVFCPGSETETKHLASRVYAADQSSAQASCLEKEHDRYHREFQEQSNNGCFVRVAVEEMH